MIQEFNMITMDYDLFISKITELVKKIMGKEYSVRIYKVTKNNALELDSLVVLREGKNFAPNIYLRPYYELYLEGSSLEELSKRICGIYRNSCIPIVEEQFDYNFEDMKPYIIYRLVSYEKNKSLLEKIPHIKYLDLAVTFHCLVRDDEDGIGTIRITNEHVASWKTTLEELNNLAVHNTERIFPSTIRSMEDVIKGILTTEFLNNEEDLPEELLTSLIGDTPTSKQQKMFILTNHKGINGASCLLYQNLLHEFANQIHSDFYILPSSIHEIILVPNNNSMSKETLSEMVKDVNRTQVAEDEVLSDRVYFFSRVKNSIIM